MAVEYLVQGGIAGVAAIASEITAGAGAIGAEVFRPKKDGFRSDGDHGVLAIGGGIDGADQRAAEVKVGDGGQIERWLPGDRCRGEATRESERYDGNQTPMRQG